ncbi:MAG: tyrosine-type recombinase/integrase [Xanthobacteraceae bacterium]|nr:tyrosine-type recombinase/integrase [Xanthobacteraceae bacterium]
MAGRQLHKLEHQTLKRLARMPGRHADGGNLYFAVNPDCSSVRWVFLYRWRGRQIEMGIGPWPAVTLKVAREKATASRALLGQGISPLEQKRAERGTVTFGDAARDLITALQPGWKNEKHAAQWFSTLLGTDPNGNASEFDYCKSLRPIAVNHVTVDHILAVLNPIWDEKPETASRLRGRIEKVLDAAKARKLRQGENPAAWKGNLDSLLSARKKSERGHHAAMSYKEVPAFLAKIRANVSMSNLCLEWAVLTAARSGEARGALWAEIDRVEKVWNVPAVRMKEDRDHSVPLTDRCMEILELAASIAGKRQNELIFPGVKKGATLSDASLKASCKRAGRGDITPHGFRSSFRDWAGDMTSHQREVAEAALSHLVGDESERAYRRGVALEKRRKLMQDWCEYVAN